MNFSVLLSLIPILVKYGPAVITFIQQEGPAVQAFIKDVEAAFAQAQSSSGTTVDLAAVLQKLFPQAAATAPPTAGPVLSGPNFKFDS